MKINICSYTLNPNLRCDDDPPLGALAPVDTVFFKKVLLSQSSLGKDVGLGLYADEDIPDGALIYVGGGQVVSDLSRAPQDKDYAGVFDEGLFIAPLDYDNPSPNWFINHNCESNVRILGRLIALARRPIKCGEELFVDYSTIAAGTDYQLYCRCMTPSCRGSVTGEDWKNIDLFKKYYGEWPSFIQRSPIR